MKGREKKYETEEEEKVRSQWRVQKSDVKKEGEIKKGNGLERRQLQGGNGG